MFRALLILNVFMLVDDTKHVGSLFRRRLVRNLIRLARSSKIPQTSSPWGGASLLRTYWLFEAITMSLIPQAVYKLLSSPGFWSIYARRNCGLQRHPKPQASDRRSFVCRPFRILRRTWAAPSFMGCMLLAWRHISMKRAVA